MKNPDRVKNIEDGVGNRVSEYSLRTFSNFAASNNITNYSFVEVTRSTIDSFETGSYIYSFDEKGNLDLLKTSFAIFDNSIALYDPSLETKKHTFSNSNIREYILLGSEISETQTNYSNQSSFNDEPKILKTMASEFLFGTSYTILKGLSNLNLDVSISSSSSIKDTRHVQLILNDNTDLVFQGIAVFYDISRHVSKKDKTIPNTPKEKMKLSKLQAVKIL